MKHFPQTLIFRSVIGIQQKIMYREKELDVEVKTRVLIGRDQSDCEVLGRLESVAYDRFTVMR